MKILILSLLLISFESKADVSFKQIFNSIKSDKTTIKRRSFNTPKFDSLQWRVKTDEDGNLTNSLRMAPLFPGHKESLGKLIKLRNRLGDTYASEIIAESCLDKSLTLIDLYYLKESIKIYHKLKMTYEDLTKVLKKGVKRDILGFNELLRMQEKLVHTKLKFNELVLNSRSIISQLNVPERLNPKRVGNLSFEGLITIEDIQELLPKESTQNIELQKLATITEIKRLDFLNESQNEGRVLSHFQVSHEKDYFGSKDRDSRVSLEFAFNLPGGGEANTQHKLLDWQRARAQHNAAKRENRSNIERSKDTLNIKIKNYFDLLSDGYLKELNSYLKLLKRSRANSPYKIVQVKEKILIQELTILRLRFEIIKDYLYSMAGQGNLAQCKLETLLTQK